MPKSTAKAFDWITFSIYLSLIAIGWAMIYTVGYGKGYTGGFLAFMNAPVGKQLIWVFIALAVFFVAYSIDWKAWRTFANFIYIGSLVSLVLVLIFGKTIHGATAWFDFGGGFTLQPSEFAKFATALALASFLGTYTVNLRNFRTQLYAIGFCLAPMALIILQPDAGSALVFLSFSIMMYREGLPGGIFLVGGSLATLFILGLVNEPVHLILGLIAVGLLILIWQLPSRINWYIAFGLTAVLCGFGIAEGYLMEVVLGTALLFVGLCSFIWLKKKMLLGLVTLLCIFIGSGLAFISNFLFTSLDDHQQDRIEVWLRPSAADPQGAAYNLNHSKMAIGSGGMWGKGFLEGTFTQGNHVPEQITDFIFCAIGEEQGFVGSLIIISLFLLLIVRIVLIAERQRTEFNRIYAYGIAGIVFTHFFVNIGMTMGVMPIIGIPLPFLSKGGSSLLGFTLMISVLLKLDANRS